MLARGPVRDRGADIVARSLSRRLGLSAVTLWPVSMYQDGDIFRVQWHDGSRGHEKYLFIFGPRSAHVGAVFADPKARQAAMRRELAEAKAALAEMKATR